MKEKEVEKFSFLNGGGEMGRLIRTFDWQATPLRSPDTWPATLQHLVAQMLANPFPMLICWGENYIQLYNDAFRPINGEGKHSQALGDSAKNTYAEVWETIGPMFAQVMAGDAVAFHDFKLPLNRNGYTEDCYFDFSSSPIKDTRGAVQGVLVICMETTEKVLALTNLATANEQLAANEARLDQVIRQLPASITMLLGEEFVIERTNPSNLAYWQKTAAEVIGKPLLEALPELAGQAFPGQLKHVLETGESIFEVEHPVKLVASDGTVNTTFVDYSYQALTDQAGKRVGVLVMSNDVTEKVVSRNLLEKFTEDLQAINEEAAATNEELAATNEEFAATNEELAATNEELSLTQQTLENTIEDLQLSEQKVRAQQKRLERFFMQAPAGICILGGPELVFELVNPLYQQLFPGRDLLNKALLTAIPEVEGTPVWDVLQNVYRTGKTFEGRELLIPVARSADGPVEDRYFDFIYQARLNEQNEIDGLLVFVIEVTANVQTRQEIERSRAELQQSVVKHARLAAIVSTTDDTIVSKTLGGVITSWNAAAERMFGYTETEAVGKHISLIIPPSRMNEEDFIIGQVKAGKKVDHFETVRIAKDGREVPISLTVSPITDAEGQIIGASKIARDISEKQKDEMRKNDFIGMVSHELKTPLTTLTALVQVAKVKLAKSDDAFLAGAMDKADMQLKKMSKMINGFLNLSRLESGKIAIDKEYFDLATLIHEVEEEVRSTYTSHEIVFAPVEPTWVNADPDKIGHVINNLINNAVKYSPTRTRIDVACQMVLGEARISVKDRGMGISPGDAEHLFDRYYRVEDVSTKHISGFGIGLYLSAEIVARHDGRIWVESELSVGSTFHFSLPLAESIDGE